MPIPQIAADVEDVGARISPLDSYLFLGVSGAVTATGFYVDASNTQIGNSFSLSIAQGNGSADPVAFASIPSGAVGAVVRLTGDVYWASCNGSATPTADFKANYANYPKELKADDWTTFGRA